MKRYFIPVLLISAAGIAAAQMLPVAIVVQQYSYAPVGVAQGTTLRLNLANLSGGTTVCMGNLSYIFSDGTTIKNENITVNAGQTVTYPLLISEITGSPATAEVRGLVKLNRQVGGLTGPPGGPASTACTAVTSLEVVDIATGQTRAILTNPLSTLPTITPVVAQPQ
jgi:hypothetical protein